jgi:hypothetical protein
MGGLLGWAKIGRGVGLKRVFTSFSRGALFAG